METRCIDLFHLTDQPVFKSLRQGLFSEDLPAQIRDLILSIHEVTSPGSPYKHCALELLICADISLAMFKSQEELASANKTIAEAIDRIHRYVLLKLGDSTTLSVMPLPKASR